MRIGSSSPCFKAPFCFVWNNFPKNRPHRLCLFHHTHSRDGVSNNESILNMLKCLSLYSSTSFVDWKSTRGANQLQSKLHLHNWAPWGGASARLKFLQLFRDKSQTSSEKDDLSRRTTKPTKWHMRPSKTPISLGIRPVWSESSLSAWRNFGSLTTQWTHSEDSDQAGWMPRLMWVFAGHTGHFVGFVMRRINWKERIGIRYEICQNRFYRVCSLGELTNATLYRSSIRSPVSTVFQRHCNIFIWWAVSLTILLLHVFHEGARIFKCLYVCMFKTICYDILQGSCYRQSSWIT